MSRYEYFQLTYILSMHDCLSASPHFLLLYISGPLKEAQLEQIAEEERSRVTAQRKLAGPMQNATLDILHQLLDPCSKAFAKMVGMDKFNWDSPSSSPQGQGQSGEGGGIVV